MDELAPASNELIVDGAEDVLAQRIQVLSAQVAELASKIGQESHIAHGIEKMVDEYRKNPGFGSADAIVDRTLLDGGGGVLSSLLWIVAETPPLVLPRPVCGAKCRA